MPSVPIETSRQAAIDRVIEVMQAHYQDQLDDVADANLQLQAPEPEHYYYVPQDPDEIIHATDVACFLSPAGPRTEVQNSAGGTSTGELQRREFPLDVYVVCRRQLGGGDVQGQGKVLSADGVLQRRTERYTGALISTVLTYCQCGTAGLIEAELVDDMPGLFYDQESQKPLYGIATVQFRFTQKVKIPLSKHS